MVGTDMSSALEQHVALTNQLRDQLRTLQATLQQSVEGNGRGPTSLVDKLRERLIRAVSSLDDVTLLQQLCQMAESGGGQDATWGRPMGSAAVGDDFALGASAASTSTAAAPAPPAAAATPSTPLNLIEAVFAAPGKLGISFLSPSTADAPHIKSIAPNSLASGPKHSDLVPGLVLHSIQVSLAACSELQHVPTGSWDALQHQSSSPLVHVSAVA